MCKTIKHKVKFKASPDEVYQVLADSKLHQECIGAKATIGKAIGERFEVFAGKITGVIVDLAPGKRIVQAWRRSDFPAGIFSMAAFTLQATKDGGTELILTHRGVPKALIPDVEAAWRRDYWQKIKNYLS
ncbi:MAG: SRPBCC domain-containing protein [Leptospirales bacterium]|nr:SRPBCC domain-containing protein [Leptospirales bacterium]